MGVIVKPIALVSMVVVLAASVGLVKAQEFTDINADFTALGEGFIRDGMPIPVTDIRRVEERQSDLTKSDVGGFLGSPNEAGSTLQASNWLYNINLPLTENAYLVCQYRVSFAQDRVVKTEWRRPQCQQRYAELSEPQEYTLSADLLFGFDSAAIAPQGNVAIRQIASEIRQNFASPSIAVLGYSDRIGAENYNMQLSERRAEAVTTALINSGVDPSWIMYEGRGASAPVAICDGAVGGALKSCLSPNRRVDISLSERR